MVHETTDSQEKGKDWVTSWKLLTMVCYNAHVYLPRVSLRVLLGCSCCSTVDETLQNVARGMARRLKREKSHWAAGRVGDIDFVGSTKTRGKVRRHSRRLRKLEKNLQRVTTLTPARVFMSSSWGCAAARTPCWSTRCWQRSGASLRRTWWWPWWEEMSWLRWSPGSGTLWERDLWRLHRAQVIIKGSELTLAWLGLKSTVDDRELVLCCSLLAASGITRQTWPR